MDIKALQTKFTEFLQKYKYILLILMIGIIFILLPGSPKEESDLPEAEFTESEESLEEKLSYILSQIQGAGNVRVLLTVASGEQVIYQTDESVSVGNESSSTQIDTVVITTADKAQTGLVRQINPPSYLGAVVICEGADRPAIQLAIVDAVSKVTGLGADKISVLKMK